MAKKITAGMAIGDVIAAFPETVPVFLEYGLHCIGCRVAASESLEAGAAAHGLEGPRFQKFIKDLNAAVAARTG